MVSDVCQYVIVYVNRLSSPLLCLHVTIMQQASVSGGDCAKMCSLQSACAWHTLPHSRSTAVPCRVLGQVCSIARLTYTGQYSVGQARVVSWTHAPAVINSRHYDHVQQYQKHALSLCSAALLERLVINIWRSLASCNSRCYTAVERCCV